MNAKTFRRFWETEASKHTLPTQGDIVDSCSPEVGALLDEIGRTPKSQLSRLLPLTGIPNVEIVDSCSPEVGAFLDEIGQATPERLAQLLA